MTATIYFKDTVNKPSVVVKDLVSIKAACIDIKVRSKNYTKENFSAFTPFAQESYAFTGKNGIFSIAGADILYVEITEG